jgi:hypothetical protein
MTPVLFTREDSPYLALGADCYDVERDALTWPGGAPAIYHPPCRSWGQYSHWAKPRAGEKELAIWSIERLRQFGGVMEHPITSKVWRHVGCIGWGMRDRFDGVLLPIAQSAFGHRARKYTGLYVVGAPIPRVPDALPATRTIEMMGRPERERTPPALASFLLDLVGTVQ